MNDNLHPYYCRPDCTHCRKVVEGDHNPFTCVFCNDNLDGLIPIERQLVSRLTIGPFRAVDESNPANVRAAEIANALLNSGRLDEYAKRRLVNK